MVYKIIDHVEDGFFQNMMIYRSIHQFFITLSYGYLKYIK